MLVHKDVPTASVSQTADGGGGGDPLASVAQGMLQEWSHECAWGHRKQKLQGNNKKVSRKQQGRYFGAVLYSLSFAGQRTGCNERFAQRNRVDFARRRSNLGIVCR